MSIPIRDQGSIILFTAIAVLLYIQVAKNIHRSGIEHYSSRILLLSAIIDISLVSTLLLLAGILGLREIFVTNEFSLIALITISSLFVLPIRSLWNYIRIPKKIKSHFHLQPDKTKEFQEEISTLTKIMAILDPIILSSPSIRIPFVYGYGSKSTYLAVPADWQTIDNNRRIMLIHELAHIRNQDVGFLSWSFAFLRDLKWMLVAIPIITVLSLTTAYEYLFGISILYLTFLLILWLVTKSVLRKRELLADLTVAMIVGSSVIDEAYDRLQSVPATGLQSTHAESSGIIHRIRNWLYDKALFSERAEFWKLIKRLFDSLYMSHPSISNRLKKIRNRHIENIHALAQLNESFWTGVTLGLLGVLIALGGFWYGKFFLKLQDDIEIASLSYRCFCSVAPIATGFVALLFILPGWSSIKTDIPTRRRLLSLLSRYLMGLIGASFVSLLILVGGWSHIEIKLLLVLSCL